MRAVREKARRALVVSRFDPGATDVSCFHATNEAFQVFAPEHFQQVQFIADAIHGEVWKYRMHLDERDGFVVVKRMRTRQVEQARTWEANDRSAFHAGCKVDEDALTEIGVLQYLNRLPDVSRHLLKCIGVFRDATHTMIVTEHCDAGDLFGLVDEIALSESEVQTCMMQLFHAVRCLHDHNIAHCDISLENILVKDGELRLMDFGNAVQIHQPQCRDRRFRYFRSRGKDYYRAPECHSPEPCGFEAAPVDLFACGVVLFMMHSQQPPWRTAHSSDDGFRFICELGIVPLWRAWGKELLSENGMTLLKLLLNPSPPTRPSIQQCLEHPWFEGR